jgi:DNA polymerase-3 subunit gamma/tau
VRLVKYGPGRIEFEPAESAPPDLAARLGRQLQAWTGQRWAISVVSDGGGATIAETRAAERDDMIGQAMRHPMLQAVIAAFPGVTDDAIRIHTPVEMDAGAPPPEEPDEDGEEWDPLDSFD